MSKTFKTDANWARFHGKEDCVEPEVKNIIEKFRNQNTEYSGKSYGAGLRYGNQRKSVARGKLMNRRSDRRIANREIQIED